jgi:hypothetical protein
MSRDVLLAAAAAACPGSQRAEGAPKAGVIYRLPPPLQLAGGRRRQQA